MITDALGAVTVVWIALPLFFGFSVYLLPQLDRYLTTGMAAISAVYGLYRIAVFAPTNLQLIDSFGVTLVADSLSGYFILMNALVTMAVVSYCWPRTGAVSDKTAFFFAQVTVLHGCMNSIFICADFMSLYVALEVIGVAAFLLIVYPRKDRNIWVGLRYLFVSNTAMLFYLMGAVLVYQANHSFAFEGLSNAPREAIALIALGLLTKGGVFVSGLWLPLTHAEVDTPVSAMLSGAVVKTGIFPLVRCALLVEEIGPMLQLFSVGTAILGTSCALLEKDTKRTLAWSTISQLGFVLVAPAAAGLYALTHGLAKVVLFLSVGNLPSRRFDELQRSPLPFSHWAVVTGASLSVCGIPVLAGFNAKALTLDQLSGWQSVAMNVAAVGTAAVMGKFIFLPFSRKVASQLTRGFWIAAALSLVSLVFISALQPEVYTVNNLVKAFATAGGGWLLHSLFQKAAIAKRIQLSHAPENLEHLIGSMSLVLLFLFWWTLP